MPLVTIVCIVLSFGATTIPSNPQTLFLNLLQTPHRYPAVLCKLQTSSLPDCSHRTGERNGVPRQNTHRHLYHMRLLNTFGEEGIL